MTSGDMKRIQAAEMYRDKRRRAIMANASDGEIATLMIRESECLLDAVSAIRARLENGARP